MLILYFVALVSADQIFNSIPDYFSLDPLFEEEHHHSFEKPEIVPLVEEKIKDEEVS